METTNTLENPRAVAGSNRAPIDVLLKDLIEGLQGDLLANEAELVELYDKLQASYERTPAEVDSQDLNAKFTDFVKKQLGTLKVALEQAQEKYKRPFLDGGKVVDGTFKRRADEVVRWQRDLQERQTKYNLAVEAEARRKAEEAAAKARTEEEAARKAAEEAAAKIADEQSLSQALQAETDAKVAAQQAIAAEQATQASLAELTRTRGDLGGVSSLRKTLVGEVTDREKLKGDAINALLPFMRADDLNYALRAWIKVNGPKDSTLPAPKLDGCQIYWQAKTR